MARVTVSDVLSWGPCSEYDDPDFVYSLIGEGIEDVMIAELQIPAWDRVWAMLQCMSDDQVREFDDWMIGRFLGSEPTEGDDLETIVTRAQQTLDRGD